MRIEKDFLGEKEIPLNALYGIHSIRAKENFPDQTPFFKEWYQAIGMVKQACYQTIDSFKKAICLKYPDKEIGFNLPDQIILDKMVESAIEVSQGIYFEQFIIPAIQGGAGTSINMNVNEIIANATLLKLNEQPGNYQKVDPIEQANLFQSTNDVIPTALKVAVMKLLNHLEVEINRVRSSMEGLETQHRNTLRTGLTQLQQAVPSSYGQLFGSYNEALSRDWWRVSKCFERIKIVNLGGGATGSGLGIPRFFIVEVVQELKKLTGFPVTQAENLMDATSNLDALVEVHAILKAHAVNLEKMANDLRLLASDAFQLHELRIPALQAGSSIMPGKVNPVIPEFVISAVHKVYSNDMLISSLVGQGMFELNAYLPVIGHALIDSLKLLIACDKSITDKLLSGLSVDSQKALENLYKSPSVCTVLGPKLGYNKASKLAVYMKEHSCNIFLANEALSLMTSEELTRWLEPGKLLQKGFSLKDIIPD